MLPEYITRSTQQPHAVERMAAWLRKASHIRASASLGCDVTLELAPDFVPIRRASKSHMLAQSVADYCRMKRLPSRVRDDAIRVGMMRIKEGKSLGCAIASAKVRADFAWSNRK